MATDNLLDQETVLKIAKLAKLELSSQDIEKYQSELSSILSLAEKMNECDTTDIDVMTHPMDAIMRLRADKVTEEESKRDAFQEIAPSTEKGLYLVPKVID